MDIEKFIPESNNNWYVDHNTIYYFKGGSIPLFRNIDGLNFVSLDLRATKKVIKIIKRLTDLEIDFYLCDRVTIAEKHIHLEDLENIIKNYLFAISNEVFFEFIRSSDFDYIRNLTNFLNLYDCHPTFKRIYEYLKERHFLQVWTDWYANITHYTVKNEEMRDYYMILERQIKLSLFFD